MSCHSTLPVGIKGKYMSASPIGSQGPAEVVPDGYQKRGNCFYPIGNQYYVTAGYAGDGYLQKTEEIICL